MLNFTTLINTFADTYTPPVSRATATLNRKTKYGFLQRTLDAYKGALHGKSWTTTELVANRVGADVYTAGGILRRMKEAELVECDDSGKNKHGRPLYLWRWL